MSCLLRDLSTQPLVPPVLNNVATSLSTCSLRENGLTCSDTCVSNHSARNLSLLSGMAMPE